MQALLYFLLMGQALIVGVGAGIGALARFGLGLIAPGAPGLVILLVINAVGSFLMGRLRPPAFWGTGFLGGFTSFSSFALALTQPPTAGIVGSVVYGVATVASCIACWWLGDMLADAKVAAA